MISKLGDFNRSKSQFSRDNGSKEGVRLSGKMVNISKIFILKKEQLDLTILHSIFSLKNLR